ncbi:MAG: Tm-1-like ATP-binding domain-containing protein [Rhodothermales bacterium]
MPTVLLIGTLDTKGDEFAFVQELIHANGCRTLVMDAGVMDEPAFAPDIPAAAVAEAGGTALEALRAEGDRGRAIEVMLRGVRRLTLDLFEAGRIDGVLGLGGGGGTNIATAAMRALPVGVPKLMVSTVVAADVRPYIDIKDVTLMYSVVDIAGINRISRRVLANAAGAISGMVRQALPPGDDRPLIAASMFGVTTPCVTALRQRLEREGYEVLVFHANGSGGRAMESLIRDGFIAGVADVTTTEWCDELVGGMLSAGPERLDAAGQAGIPQVVSVGALDMVNFHARATVPDRFRDRTLYVHNPNVTLMRTTPEENRRLGEVIANKLNAAAGPVCLMLPLRGVSTIDAPGQPFYDPAADAALFDALRAGVLPHVALRELDVHINDPVFAEALADELLARLHAS